MTGSLAGRLRLTSYRARAAAGILVAIVAIALVALVLYGVIQQRARADVEATLRMQAGALARTLVIDGRGSAAENLADASRLLPDTRIVVRIDGVDQYWNRTNRPTYASGTATDDWATVTLYRIDPISAVNTGLLLLVVAVGVAAAAGIAWLVSGSLARRLGASLRDLSATAQRVAEGHLDVRAEETPDEVGSLAASFNRMTARLEAADARQREFLADVAHELRTPVTSIEGFATALEDGTARTEEDRREAAAFIREEAARLRGLVRDLQELTWLDLDPPVAREAVDLAVLAREAVARLGADAAARGVDLAAEGDETPVVTDPVHVATILGNLVSNALKATPAGGSVRVRVGADGGDAFVAVADTGRGIPEEHIPYLFDRLFRIDTSRRRDDDAGSGLGLSIVRRLALLLDGKVTVRSAVGEGSVFTVWLLGARAAAASAGGSARVRA